MSARIPIVLGFVFIGISQPPAQIPAAPAPASVSAAARADAGDEGVRAAVEAYYEAQARRDPDEAAAFWSVAANPRLTRDAFVAMFGAPAEDQYSAQIRAVTIAGADARVRVVVTRTRVIIRDGRANTERAVSVNSQLWRQEPGGWKLFRDGPFADEIADDLIAAQPSERPALLEKNRADLVPARLAISQRATMAITLGRSYERARALFELALDVARAAGDRHGEANSLHNLAQVAFFLRQYPAAVEAYGRELALAREIDDDDAAAAAQFGLATVAYSRAEYTPALGFYREALAVYERRDDGSAIGRTVVSIGNVQYLQAEYDAAAASYRRGLALALASSDRTGASFARGGLGRVFAAQGDIPAALDMYGQVLADARAGFQADPRTKSNVGAALESIGEIHVRLGNTDRARAAFEEAKRLAEGDPDIETQGRVLSMLGMTELVAGRFDAALADYTDSRARFEAAKNSDGIAHAWVGVGFSQAARERFTEAATAYRTAIGLFERVPNDDGAARALLGLSMAQSGASDQTGALESARKVSVIAELLHSEDLAWRGATRTGEALRKLDRLDDARQAFERATAAIDRLADEAAVNPEARSELNDSAAAWNGLALTLAGQGDAAGALRALEGRRAHIRRVALAPFQRDIVRGATPDELADEQAIVREIIATRAQLRAESRSARRDPARAESLGHQLAALAARRADQQARLYTRAPALQLWRGLAPPDVAPEAVADMVPGPHGLLLVYLITDDELLIVSVARGDHGPDIAATTTSNNRRAFADVLAAAMQPSVLGDGGQWQTRAAGLTAALLEPVAARLQGRARIVVVPDDLLWKVPFEALPAPKALDPGWRPGVTYATSLATLMLQRRAAGPAIEHPVPGFLAAPAVPAAIRTQILLTLPSWQPQDAPAALEAARQSARPYGAGTTIETGADASESAARRLIEDADVVHVQAPLQVNGAAPLLSSVILGASGETLAEDGRFEAREWFAVTARARVLVLPDGSAFGAAGVGHAMDSLAWAATAAGVPTLILGRWPPAGFGGDAVVARFHAGIAAGAAPDEAWRAAVDEARQKDAAPASWAGARLIGGGFWPPADRR